MAPILYPGVQIRRQEVKPQYQYQWFNLGLVIQTKATSW